MELYGRLFIGIGVVCGGTFKSSTWLTLELFGLALSNKFEKMESLWLTKLLSIQIWCCCPCCENLRNTEVVDGEQSHLVTKSSLKLAVTLWNSSLVLYCVLERLGLWKGFGSDCQITTSTLNYPFCSLLGKKAIGARWFGPPVPDRTSQNSKR